MFLSNFGKEATKNIHKHALTDFELIDGIMPIVEMGCWRVNGTKRIHPYIGHGKPFHHPLSAIVSCGTVTFNFTHT
jgi:hypothetical protein